MTINWYGQSCFKIANQGNHLTVVTDPFDKSIGLNPPRGNADIITVSHSHYDHNNISTITGEPFIIEGAGEYEIKGISVTGVRGFHDEKKGQERGQNIIYLIKIDGIRMCHLGDLGQKSLSSSQLEAIGKVDILMIPIGGVYTIDAHTASKITKQIEPNVIIPMHYKIKKLKADMDIEGVDGFLKEMGLDKKSPIEKLVISKKDLSNKEMEVVVMGV